MPRRRRPIRCPTLLLELGTSGCVPEQRSQVASGLGVVVGALPTGSIASCNRQPSESGVVHDHIRLRQHQIAAVACIGVRIRTRHVEHASPSESGETVGGSSCGGELSSGEGSTKMISDSSSYAYRYVLV
jgi:hypothetical protein